MGEHLDKHLPLIRKSLSPADFSRARKRLLQMHYESRVGHLGGNLSAIDALLVLFNEYLSKEDAFVLSKGHSAGALYVALWSVGRLNDSDLRCFHKDDTLLPGHPPASGIDDVMFATGSLGHGLSLAAGTALGFALRQSTSRVYCFTSDGEWQEGSTWEALIFSSHHRLANLTIMIDHNNLQGFGTTHDVASMSPIWEKLRGFDVEIHVINGHDPNALRIAIERPALQVKIIVLKTTKGKGVQSLEDRMESHYLPLTQEQYAAALAELGMR